MSFTIAALAGLTKAGMNAYDQYQNKKDIEEANKRREENIAEIKKQQADNVALNRNTLSSIMGKIGLSKDPTKTQQLGSIYQNTQRAGELQAIQARQEIGQLNLSKQTVPDFNIMGLIGDTASGAIQGYQLEQALTAETNAEAFRDQMRDLFLSEFNDEDMSVDDANDNIFSTFDIGNRDSYSGNLTIPGTDRRRRR